MASARPFVAAFVAAAIGAGFAGAASGQPASPVDRSPARVQVQVEGVDVEQVERLAPGVALNFSVYGSAGAAAMLRIDGARAVVELRETQPGIYEGTHVIAAHDRIRANSHVVVTLARGAAIVQASLEESLQVGQGPVAPLAVEIAGPSHGERFEPDTAEHGGPLPAVASPGRARSFCDTCGTVEAIRVVPEVQGPGNLGAVSGTLIGALLGERAREAHMRRIARIHGSVTGALTGRRADRDGAARHEVRFRMPDGRTRWRSYPEAPAFQVGDRVSLGGPHGADAAALPARP